jgi:hypothetical protein
MALTFIHGIPPRHVRRIPSTLLRGVGDKGRIHLFHVRTLAQWTDDFITFMLFQRKDQ